MELYFIHAVECDRTFLKVNSVVIYAYAIFSYLLSVNKHWVFYIASSIVNNTEMSMTLFMNIYKGPCFQFFWMYIHNRIANPDGYLNEYFSVTSLLFTTSLKTFYIPTRRKEESQKIKS